MSDQEVPKIVPLFGSGRDAKREDEEPADDSAESFRDVMRRNQENKDRLNRERLKANKGVLRSYRIKN